MLEDEDDDLVALRRAALASIQGKRKGEDLSDLRNAALNTRKQFNNKEGTYVFQKVDPPNVSNLISISTQPQDEAPKNNVRDKFNRNRSESESSDYEKDGSRSRHSSSYSTSSSYSESESTSESENEKQPEKNKVEEKKKADDDDILNAIEEFLDEGNEIEEKLEKKEVKKEKKKKERRKKIKPPRLVSKSGEKSERMNDHNVKKNNKDRRNFNKDSVAKSIRRDGQNYEKREQHIPLKHSRENDFERSARRPKEDDLNSVHSSDLSFIEDLSDQENNSKRPPSPVKSKPFLSKVNDSTNTVQNKVTDVKKLPQQRIGTKINLSHIKAPTVDLRDKLKTKGLHNKSKQQQNENIEHRTNGKSETLSPNIKVNIKKKIYVKPGFVTSNADVLEFQKQKKTIESNNDDISWKDEDASKIVITRGILDDGFTPISVRLKDSADTESAEDERPAKIRRGRRSVVQFSPDTTVTEKMEKIEDLMKKGVEKRKEDLAYSDMSDQDFEEFEIEDEVGKLEVEDVPQQQREFISKPETNSSYPKTDTRRFVRKSSTSSESDRDSLDLNSGAYENKRTKNAERVSLKVEKNLPRDVAAELNRRKRSSSADFDRENTDVLDNHIPQHKNRPLSVISSHISLPRNDSDAPRRDDVTRTDGVRRRRVGVAVKRRDRSPVRDSRPKYKRDSHSIKSRLGSNFPLITREMSPSPPPRRKQRRGEYSPPRRPLKEEEVDARIRRINQQNAAILKRRREVEQEEKRFC